MTDLNELLKRLLEAKLDFVLVGGFAGVVHGGSQVTQDVDICLLISEEEIAKLRGTLKDLNPVHRMNPNNKLSFLKHPKSLAGVKNIYLETDIGVLDIMSEIPNLGGFDRVHSSAIEIEIFDHKCKVMCLDDLIEVKKHLKRSKDQALFHELVAIKERTGKS